MTPVARKKNKPTSPIRTCIGCRRRRARAALLRIGLSNDALLIDQPGAGRGAWLCRSIALAQSQIAAVHGPVSLNSDLTTGGKAKFDPSCVEAAVRSKAFSRALRSKLVDRVCGDTLLGWLGKPTH